MGMKKTGITQAQLVRLQQGENEVILELTKLYRPLIWGCFRGHPFDVTAEDWQQESMILLIQTGRNLAASEYRAFTSYFQKACWRRMQRLKSPKNNCMEQTVHLGDLSIEAILPKQGATLRHLELCVVNQITLNQTTKPLRVTYDLMRMGYLQAEMAQILRCSTSKIRLDLGKVRKQLEHG